MKELGFVCAWEKSREKSWSGTHYGLYSNLCRHYNIIDVDIGENRDLFTKTESTICKLIKKIFKYDDMNLSAIKKRNRVVKKWSKDNDIPLIQFDECLFDHSHFQFIYQDLNVGYVKRMAMDEPDIYLCEAMCKFLEGL